jgi:hypothetical protein
VVRCGDDGTTCPANDTSLACCVTFDFDAGTGKGTCVAPHACPSSSALLYCDDSSDCAATVVEEGGAAVCGVSTTGDFTGPVTGAACMVRNVYSGIPVLCQDRAPCPLSNATCVPNVGGAPGYYYCQE